MRTPQPQIYISKKWDTKAYDFQKQKGGKGYILAAEIHVNTIKSSEASPPTEQVNKNVQVLSKQSRSTGF